MPHRGAGDTTSIGQRASRNELRFRNGSGINTVKFEIKVKDFAVLGCEVPRSSMSRSLAGFFSALFNDGCSTNSGDLTGDVGHLSSFIEPVIRLICPINCVSRPG
jgi:hypothetical protein